MDLYLEYINYLTEMLLLEVEQISKLRWGLDKDPKYFTFAQNKKEIYSCGFSKTEHQVKKVSHFVIGNLQIIYKLLTPMEKQVHLYKPDF